LSKKGFISDGVGRSKIGNDPATIIDRYRAVVAVGLLGYYGPFGNIEVLIKVIKRICSGGSV
jgi:hypothetical protein